MRVFSWNVNGLRAVCRKGLPPWEVLAEADVICLQETKASPERLEGELVEPPGWESVWASAERPGYAGTAIYFRKPPDEVIPGLAKRRFDIEGRLVGVRYGDVALLSAYFPNSQEGGARLDYKLAFCRAVQRFQKALHERGLASAVLGDFNIAHRPIDLARPKQNEKNPGYLPEERAWLTRYLGAGFHDVFREENPGLEGAYTWWSFRSGARERNVGWRIDYGCVCDRLRDRAAEPAIHPEIAGSDHCPVSLRVEPRG